MATNDPNTNADVTHLDPKPNASEPQQELSDMRIFSKIGFYVGLVAMLFFPLGGVFFNGFVGAVCAGGGSALGAAVGSFLEAWGEKTQPALSSTSSRLGPFALVLGAIGLVAWLIPIAGLPITIAGFFIGKRSLYSIRRRVALTGMGLSTIGLILSSINAYLGALMAVKNSMGK